MAMLFIYMCVCGGKYRFMYTVIDGSNPRCIGMLCHRARRYFFYLM